MPFPTSPTTNQEYTENGKTWYWAGSGKGWRLKSGLTTAVLVNDSADKLVEGATNLFLTALERVKIAAAAATNIKQAWTAAQRTTPTTIASASSLNFLLGDGNDRFLTLDQHVLVPNPSDIADHIGQKGTIAGVQSGSSNFVLTFGTFWFPIGTTSIPSTPSGTKAQFRLDYHVVHATRIDFSLASAGNAP